MGSPAAPAELVGSADHTKAPSGRLLLRMPRALHGELARAAEREGVSLNGFITGALGSAIGWQGEDGELPVLASVRAADSAGRRQTRLVLAALVANAVVVGLAALAALGILLLAWLG